MCAKQNLEELRGHNVLPVMSQFTVNSVEYIHVVEIYQEQEITLNIVNAFVMSYS